MKPLGEYNDFFNLYEIIPGFLTSLIVTYIVSLITKNRIEMLKTVVVIIWIVFVKPLGEYNDFFNLYEIIPGFLTSLIVTYIVSLITKTE